MRPELPGGLLPVFVLDRYEGLEARLLQDFTAGERARATSRRTSARCASCCPADLVFTNHVLMGGAVGAALGERVPRQGARLRARVLDARPARARARGARESLARRRGGLRRLAAHPRGARGGRRPRRARRRGAARASTSTSSCRRSAPRRSPSCSPRPAPTRRTRATREERLPDEGNAARLEAFFAGDEPTVVYFGKLIENKGVQLLLEALDGARRARGDRRLRRLPRRARAAGRGAAAGRVLFTGPLEHRHLVHLLPLADAAVVPSIFPEAFGMVAAEAAACGCPPLVARHTGLAEIAAGLEAGLPGAPRATWPAFETGDVADLRAKLAELLALAGADREALRAAARAHRRRALVVGGRRRAVARAGRVAFRGRWARNSAFPPRSSSPPRARPSRSGTDFTVAVEEEFALLDPETLGLVEPVRGGQGGRGRHRRSSRTSSAS